MPENTIFAGALGLNDILTINNIIIYLLVINLTGFLTMFLDKKKAEKGKWRTPENTIFLITIFGGGIGTISGMYLFRHKTKKLKFTLGLPAIVIAQIILCILYLVY